MLKKADKISEAVSIINLIKKPYYINIFFKTIKVHEMVLNKSWRAHTMRNVNYAHQIVLQAIKTPKKRGSSNEPKQKNARKTGRLQEEKKNVGKTPGQKEQNAEEKR